MDGYGTTRVTEQAHPKTYNIDVAASSEIVDLLRLCDLDIFEGWNGSQGLFNDTVISNLESVAEDASSIIQRKCAGEKTGIVLAGCGTSGGLAFMVARQFNEHLFRRGISQTYDYLIAGNDIALFLSPELIEDDPHAGRQQLEELTRSMEHVLYIGITCGLSSAYVAGQLDHCMDNLHKYTPVLMGFNPIHLAKDLPSEHWDKSFKQVATRLECLMSENKGYIVNPIIGPEPITGSTRMKSGSATKILLEVIFTMAHMKVFHPGDVCKIAALFESYRLVHTATYSTLKGISQLVELGGRSLTTGHHICYTATDSLGIVGMIDASECPPTCGSANDDVRGFLQGGFDFLKNREGHLPGQIQISLDFFTKKVLPTLTHDDLIIVLARGDAVIPNQTLLEATKAMTVLVLFDTPGTSGHPPKAADVQWTHQLHIVLPWSDLASLLPPTALQMCETSFTEMSCKWLCNALSTCAHILHGKFYHNLMLDVQVRNEKLYNRAVRIIKETTECNLDDAITALLKSIYQRDSLDDVQLQNPVSVHVQKAALGHKVVPVAVLLITLGCKVEKAHDILGQHKMVRTAIKNALEHKS